MNMTLLKPLIFFIKLVMQKRIKIFTTRKILFNKNFVRFIRNFIILLLNTLSKIDQSLKKIGELFVKKDFHPNFDKFLLGTDLIFQQFCFLPVFLSIENRALNCLHLVRPTNLRVGME